MYVQLDMRYEWDELKRAKNITPHGVDFAQVDRFDWATSLTVADERFGEDRYSALGLIDRRLYFLAYTIRRKATLRLISMRKANS